MQLAIGLKGRTVIVAAAVVAIAALFGFSAPAGAQSAAASAPAVPANTSTKVALIIGNGAYLDGPALPNPPHDATDIAAAFGRLSFSVRLLTDATYNDMKAALQQFSSQAQGSEMAVVYFAGHGIELGGENWLIPVDAKLDTDQSVEAGAITLNAIMQAVSGASKLGLVILDACRNNPFLIKITQPTADNSINAPGTGGASTTATTVATRSVGKGLSAPVEPTNNVLVAYAAKDGTTAADGNGRNSPFTAALLKYLETPGLEINFLFRDVRDDVIASTGSAQQPFTYGSLSKEAIYLKPVLSPTPPAPKRIEAETGHPATVVPKGSGKCFTFQGRQFCE